MDMKKILQALDGASEKPVVNSNDMKKFLRAVTEADVNQPVIENIEELGDGAQKKTNPDGTYEIGDGSGLKLYSADGKLLKTISPTFNGFSQETDTTTGNVTQRYNAGPMSTSQTKDKAGKVVSTNAEYDLGLGKLGLGQEKGITTKSWAPRSSDIDPITQKDLYAGGNKDKEATYDRAMKQVAQTNEEVGMSRLLSIITEGKGPLNRPTAAESITMQHYTAPKKTITAPVLNVQEGAKPSMIGKYFKTVEQELKEAASRPNERARQLAERVIERVIPGQETPPGINRLTGKPIVPEPEPVASAPEAPAGPKGANLKMTVLQQLKAGTYKGFAPKLTPEEIDAAIAYKQSINDLQEQFISEDLEELFDLRNKIEEAIKQRLDPKCWKGKHKEGTKIKGGVRVNNCVPNESIAEDDAGDVEQRMIAKIQKEKQRLANLKQTDPEAYKREMAKRKTSSRIPPVSTFEDQGVTEGLNEFAPNGFNGGDDGDEFSPEMAKMAYDEGFTKGASLADGATLQRAMAINDWDKHDGGIYSQHFAKGFIAGRKDKIRHNNKQYNLNLKLMKDGSIRHGDQGVAEGLKDPKDNPCWKGYKPVGTKKKGGATVPNCVPKEGVAEAEQRMSRAAKGNEKYGKDGMKALAKAGREGKDLEKIRDKYNKYDEGVAASAAQQAAIAIAKKKAGKK